MEHALQTWSQSLWIFHLPGYATVERPITICFRGFLPTSTPNTRFFLRHVKRSFGVCLRGGFATDATLNVDREHPCMKVGKGINRNSWSKQLPGWMKTAAIVSVRWLVTQTDHDQSCLSITNYTYGGDNTLTLFTSPESYLLLQFQYYPTVPCVLPYIFLLITVIIIIIIIIWEQKRSWSSSMYFHPALRCYFIPLRSKYSPQQPAQKHL